jgi:hypothetical protein
MSYTPFKQMEAKLASKPGVTNPAALSAYLAKKKYGAKAVQTAAKNGTSLRKKKRKSKAIAAFIKAPK